MGSTFMMSMKMELKIKMEKHLKNIPSKELTTAVKYAYFMKNLLACENITATSMKPSPFSLFNLFFDLLFNG